MEFSFLQTYPSCQCEKVKVNILYKRKKKDENLIQGERGEKGDAGVCPAGKSK